MKSIGLTLKKTIHGICRIGKFAAILVLGLHSIQTSAAPVTFNFAGVVSAVDPSISGQFAVGQEIYGTYTFESATQGLSFSPDGILDPGITYYPAVLKAFTALIGNYGVSLGGINRIFVINNDSAGIDRYALELLAPAGDNVAGLPVSDLVMNFQDNFGTILSDGSLLLSAPEIASFPSAVGNLDFVTGINPQNRVTFLITSVTGSPAAP